MGALWAELLDGRWTESAQMGIAVAALGLVLAGIWLRRTGRDDARRRRVWDAGLLGLVALGALTWNTQVLRSTGVVDVHAHDFFLYYMGAKYFPELGYTRLYECSLIADHEAGYYPEIAEYPIRNLETNEAQKGDAVVLNPDRCKRHFSAERWRQFSHDVGWFRSRLPPRKWAKIRLDHGFNAPPAWTLMARPLASTGPASAAQVRRLALLDPLLLAAAFASLGWAFGWRPMALAFLFWSANYPARWGWTGGSLLRNGWLSWSLIGLALLRKQRPVLSGAALAYATSLRVFPGVLVLGVAAAAALRMLRTRSLRMEPRHWKFGASAATTLLALVAVSGTLSGGVESWTGFVENSRRHLANPLTNYVGFKTLLSYDPDERLAVTKRHYTTEPLADWKTARAATFDGRRVFFWLGIGVFGLIWLRAVWRQPDWVAALLGVAVVPVAFELTSYYHAILLAFALLWPARPGVVAALFGLAALGWWIGTGIPGEDVRYVWLGAANLAFVGFATLALWRFQEAGAAGTPGDPPA